MSSKTHSAAAVEAAHDSRPLPSNDLDEDEDDEDTQDISGRNINPAKLTALLRAKFGVGAYAVHMMHNSYCVKAPTKLSLSEIAQCKRR